MTTSTDTVTAEITLTGGGDQDPFGGDRPWRHNAWTVDLSYQGRTMQTPFYTGELADEPTARDVLECLLSDASTVENESFEDFARGLGYDTDSRRAEATYRATVEQTNRLRDLLADDFDAAVFPRDGDLERAARRLTA